MYWEERLRVAIREKNKSAPLAISFDAWEKEDQKIHDDLVFEKVDELPKEYIKFLEIFDGLSVDSIVLYGEAHIGLYDIRELWRRWSKYSELAPFMVIGEHSSGEPIVIDRRNGSVLLLELPDLESFFKIADDFESFMDCVILGSSYDRLYPGESGVATEWKSYLINKGWYQN